MLVTLAISKRRLNFIVHIDGIVSVQVLYTNKAHIEVVNVVATTIKLVFESRLQMEGKNPAAVLGGIRFLEDAGWKTEIISNDFDWKDALN